MVYDESIRENESYVSQSQSEQPRNFKQVQNMQYIRKYNVKKKNEENEGSEGTTTSKSLFFLLLSGI